MLPTADARPDTTPPTMELTGRLRADPSAAFIAGDERANENWPLTSLHTLFVREHNRIVAELPDDLLPEARFQIARRVVIAELQRITFREYLPAMGIELDAYAGYDESVDPTITDEFATAAFRMHSQVHGELRLTDTYGGLSSDALAALAAEGITPTEGDELEVFVPLDVAFANPTLLREVGVDAILQALTWDVGYANDATIDDALRSVLFEMPAPGADPASCLRGRIDPRCFRGVVDLAAIDIARGYDHGLPTYNQLRIAYGLEPVTSFAELTGEPTDELPNGMTIDDPEIMRITRRYDRDGRPIAQPNDPRSAAITSIERSTTTAARLRALYGDVDELDAFTGMQVEVREPDSELGQLQAAIWSTQFRSLRDGDRWFCEGDPVLREIAAEYGIDFERTLDDIVRDNARTLLQVPTTLFEA
jgi:Animal haem peroxidase